VCVTKCDEDLSNIVLMFLQHLRPDDDIIEVYMANLANEVTKGGRHPSLMRRGSISHIHWHDHPFIKTPGCMDRKVFHIIWVYLHLKKRISHVNLTENFTLGTIVQYFIDTR
jgi:hypothetical protein